MNEIMYFLAGLLAGVLLYKLLKPKKEFWMVTYELQTYYEDDTEMTQKVEIATNVHPSALMNSLRKADIKDKKEGRDGKVDHIVRVLLCCVPMTRKQYLDYYKPDQE